MPTITFNIKELEKQIGKKLTNKLLEEKVPFLGTPIEAINSKEMTLEINPNRPDLLSLPGFARAFSSFIGIKKGLRKYSAKKSSYSVIVDDAVKKVRPFTVCAVVKGISFSDEKIKEIVDLQEKIHITYGRNRRKMALGIYPLDMISFPITYTAKKPEEIVFEPLDFSKSLDGKQILSLHPAGQKYSHLLNDFKKFPVFIDSKKQALSMPPIINSNRVGKVTAKTKNVFIECSGFDFDYLSKALNMVVTALADIGGEIYEVLVEYANKKIKTPILEPEKKKIDCDYINHVLGTNFSKAEIKRLLEKMGFGTEGNNALIPCYRSDILHQADFSEEVAIAYGYENIGVELPNIGCHGKESELSIFKNHLRDILVGAGFLEIKNFLVSNREKQNKMVFQEEPLVELEESFSEEYSALRRDLLPGLLDVLSRNKHREYPQNIFEIGKVFHVEKEIFEKERLGVVLCNKDADFTRIKQITDMVLRELGISYEAFAASVASFQYFINGRAAKIAVNQKEIAHFGEISPKVLEKFDIEMPVAYLSINIEKLYESLSSISE